MSEVDCYFQLEEIKTHLVFFLNCLCYVNLVVDLLLFVVAFGEFCMFTGRTLPKDLKSIKIN